MCVHYTIYIIHIQWCCGGLDRVASSQSLTGPIQIAAHFVLILEAIFCGISLYERIQNSNKDSLLISHIKTLFVNLALHFIFRLNN